jgi:hypothetical protein
MDPNQGIDLERRPGVPMERVTAGGAPTEMPVPQKQRFEVLHEPARKVTPVFGTGPQPRGLSGVMRRIAYRIPDYRIKRWLLLLLADRVDAQERALARLFRVG